MNRQWDELVDQVAWSVMVGVSSAVVLLPLFASVASAQPLVVEPAEVGMDLAGLAAMATGLALATEWLRSLVPAWRRGTKADAAALAAVDAARAAGLAGAPLETLRRLAVATGGPGEAAKTALRVVPVLLGVVAALVGMAPAVGDGSNPEALGGIGAGLIASLFGGSLVSAVRSRLPGASARRVPMTTQEYRVQRDAEAGD